MLYFMLYYCVKVIFGMKVISRILFEGGYFSSTQNIWGNLYLNSTVTTWYFEEMTLSASWLVPQCRTDNQIGYWKPYIGSYIGNGLASWWKKVTDVYLFRKTCYHAPSDVYKCIELHSFYNVVITAVRYCYYCNQVKLVLNDQY